MWIVIYYPNTRNWSYQVYYGPFKTRNDAKLWIRSQKQGLSFEIAQLDKP